MSRQSEAVELRRRVSELEKALASREEQVDTQAKRLEGCTDEVMRLRKQVGAKSSGPSEHVVRAFEAGARAERARVLEQSRISLMQWVGGSAARRGLDVFREELRDERLPLPTYKPEGA